MKNQIVLSIVLGLIFLAVIGLVSDLVKDPAGFLQWVAIMIVTSAIIFFLVKRFNKQSPEKREQRAFMKAAKKSSKKYKQKDITARPSNQKNAKNNLTSIKRLRTKKKSDLHLTVIEGKKGKKKNRASF